MEKKSRDHNDDDESVNKQSSARSSVRRERKPTENEGKSDDASGQGNYDAEAAPKGRRRRTTVEVNANNSSSNNTGGWMSPSGKTNSMLSTNLEEDAAGSPNTTSPNIINPNNKDKHFQEDQEDVMIIPDLDEENGNGDNDHRIAHAPRNVTRKIPTLHELDAEIGTMNKNSGSGPSIGSGYGGSGGGNNDFMASLNLGILTSTLVPASTLHEADELWTFDTLLREITNELSDVPKPAANSSSGNTNNNNQNHAGLAVIKKGTTAASTNATKNTGNDNSKTPAGGGKKKN